MLWLLVYGCLPAHSKAPGSPPVDPTYYDYDAHASFTATETPLKVVGGIQISTVTYPSPVTTPYPEDNIVTAYLFLPPGPGPHPAMVVLHEWLPRDLGDEFRLCEGIAHARVAALLVVEPFSLNRRPHIRPLNVELLSSNLPQMKSALRQCILDCRRGLDWLSTRPDIDPNRMGVSGISLGGIMAPVLAGVDHRAKVVLTFVGGADVADLLWSSPMLRGLHNKFDAEGVSYTLLKREMAPSEPSNWLHGFDRDNALMFNGRYDVFVTPEQATHLARALGGAHIVWANTGHYGIALSETQAEEIGDKFLQSRFFADAPSFTPPDTLPSKTIKLGILFGGQEGASPDIAYQIINFDRRARYSLDGQLTFHGISAGLSGRIDDTTAVGLEFPLLHGSIKPRPFFLWHFVL